MYRASVITNPRQEPNEKLQLQSRSLQDALDSLPPEGVLIKTQAAGICHTDLHLWHGHYKVGLNDDDVLEFLGRPGMFYPIVPGHEIAGVVYATGEMATASSDRLKIGDRVCVYPWIGCGQCLICSSGDTNLCREKSRELGFCADGGYSEFVQVPDHRYVLSLPETIPFSVGALLPCSGLTAYSSLRKCVPVAKQVRGWGVDVVVAVVGLGGVGQWALNLLPFCLGKEGVKIIGIDISSRKIDFVKRQNLVDETFHLCPEDSLDQQVEKFSSKFDSKPSIVLDFVNSRNSFGLSVRLLARAGIHVMVGLHGGLGELQLPLEVINVSSHVANLVGSPRELEELVKLVDERKISSPEIKTYELIEATKALTDLEDGRLVEGKAVITFKSQ